MRKSEYNTSAILLTVEYSVKLRELSPFKPPISASTLHFLGLKRKRRKVASVIVFCGWTLSVSLASQTPRPCACIVQYARSRQASPGRCSGKFVAPENYSHTQQYGLGLRLRIGLNLGLGLEVGLRLGLGLTLALVTLWQYGGGKNFPGATNFPRHRDAAHACHNPLFHGMSRQNDVQQN